MLISINDRSVSALLLSDCSHAFIASACGTSRRVNSAQLPDSHAVTAFSPIQFQKRIRLPKSRLLLLTGTDDDLGRASRGLRRSVEGEVRAWQQHLTELVKDVPRLDAKILVAVLRQIYTPICGRTRRSRSLESRASCEAVCWVWPELASVSFDA